MVPMFRDLILGTAGHIDHGKTSLVKALTGIDTDRLPEEKARGITIDIGFARLDLGDYRLGIVDVPGHERFIKNMLAGATGVDLALLVVAADDSVMPQTREHLEILRLLGQRVRVRALHNHDTPVEEVHRGMRAAINLAGVAHEDVFRGQELATPGYLRPARTLTVRLKAADDARRPLRHRTPVRLHIGTAEILARVSLLDHDDLKPGEWGLAQLFLDEPAVAVWGHPFVVRESSAATTP